MIPQSSLGLVDLKVSALVLQLLCSLPFQFPGSEAAKKMEEKAPNAILPTEIWHLIINNLERKGLARASMTCSTFRNIIENDEILRKKVHLPSFDSITSRNVQLRGLNHNEAVLEENAETDPYSYPRWFKQIVYVVPTGNFPEIVHFRVTNPGNFLQLRLSIDRAYRLISTTSGYYSCVCERKATLWWTQRERRRGS